MRIDNRKIETRIDNTQNNIDEERFQKNGDEDL
jgi:hypothetical protein